MGPVAVLADIHGNLAALEAVLAALRPVKPRAYLVLGDVFGELGQALPVLEMCIRDSYTTSYQFSVR